MWLILSSFCVVLVLWLLFKTINRDYWKKRNVVHLNQDLFAKFLFGEQSLCEVYKDVYDNHPNEPYVGAFLNTKPVLILRDLKNIQAVLVSDFESYYSRGFQVNDSDILADNILSTPHYQRWRTLRQKMSPMFTSSKLKSMSGIIERSARDFVEMVKRNKEMRERPFDALNTYTSASIGASVFGIDTHVKDTMDSPFLEMSQKSVEPSFFGNLTVTIGVLLPKLYRLLNIKVFGNYEKFFIGVVEKVLMSRRKNPQPIDDFMGLSMEIQNAGTMKDKTTGYEIKPTDELLAAQAFFFFIAGTDTGANTMHFTLLELSSNPDVLQRLHEEIDKKFKETNGELTFDDVEDLVYLDMVLNESMRKYPPIGLMQRICTRDAVLPVGNLKVEKDVITVTPVFAIHRDERLFPNPDKFDPERFAPSNAANLPNFGYMPFGEGKRICLGARYARVQVKFGLAFLLRLFTLKHQNYQPKHFEKSVFSLRDHGAKFELVLRENVM